MLRIQKSNESQTTDENVDAEHTSDGRIINLFQEKRPSKVEEVKVDLEQNKIAINLRNLPKESGRNDRHHAKSLSITSGASRNNNNARFKLHSRTTTPQNPVNVNNEE